MGHHVEIERVGNGRAGGLRMRADFHEAVTGIGVVESGKDDDLELPVVAREMPIDGAAEVTLPDVEHEADRAEDMCLLELRRALGDAIEMPLLVRAYRSIGRPAIRRQMEARRSERTGVDAIRGALVDRIDQQHPLVGRSWPDRARRAGNADRFRRPFRMHVGRLREKPEPHAARAALLVHVPPPITEEIPFDY